MFFFSSSVSESLRPPHLVAVLQVESSIQSPFITCSILTGNFKGMQLIQNLYQADKIFSGAFSVTPNGGNCELRTQMELDREEIERYESSTLILSNSS